MTSLLPVLCIRQSSQLVFFRFFRLLFFSNEFLFPIQNAFLPFATQYTYYTYTSSPSLFAIISLETFQSFQRKHAFFCVPIRRLILIMMFITFLESSVHGFILPLNHQPMKDSGNIPKLFSMPVHICHIQKVLNKSEYINI